uniref:CARD domain-containing protein n=1 Tax=Poecilia latipinna TaxID=48699 RepID=A0A3B3VGG7_9TELE
VTSEIQDHKDFVERVSEEILKQLLDDLLSDRVFNYMEIEEILQKNPIRADKARNTIDAVMKKGQRACRLMIQRLHHIDPTLSNQLGLSSDSFGPGETHSSLNNVCVRPLTLTEAQTIICP